MMVGDDAGNEIKPKELRLKSWHGIPIFGTLPISSGAETSQSRKMFLGHLVGGVLKPGPGAVPHCQCGAVPSCLRVSVISHAAVNTT